MWTRNTGVNPYSSTISVLGSFTRITWITYGLPYYRPGWDSNPHSDATRTWVWCIKSLIHYTPYNMLNSGGKKHVDFIIRELNFVARSSLQDIAWWGIVTFIKCLDYLKISAIACLHTRKSDKYDLHIVYCVLSFRKARCIQFSKLTDKLRLTIQ